MPDAPRAQELGCEDAPEVVAELARETGAARQRRLARTQPLAAPVKTLSGQFSDLDLR